MCYSFTENSKLVNIFEDCSENCSKKCICWSFNRSYFGSPNYGCSKATESENVFVLSEIWASATTLGCSWEIVSVRIAQARLNSGWRAGRYVAVLNFLYTACCLTLPHLSSFHRTEPARRWLNTHLVLRKWSQFTKLRTKRVRRVGHTWSPGLAREPNGKNCKLKF